MALSDTDIAGRSGGGAALRPAALPATRAAVRRVLRVAAWPALRAARVTARSELRQAIPLRPLRTKTGRKRKRIATRLPRMDRALDWEKPADRAPVSTTASTAQARHAS